MSNNEVTYIESYRQRPRQLAVPTPSPEMVKDNLMGGPSLPVIFEGLLFQQLSDEADRQGIPVFDLILRGVSSVLPDSDQLQEHRPSVSRNIPPITLADMYTGLVVAPATLFFGFLNNLAARDLNQPEA